MSSSEPDVWFQNVTFKFIPFDGFENLDNDILKELLNMSERVKEEPIAYVALTVTFAEKYLDVLVRWHAQQVGKKLNDILKNHGGSDYHKFRKAAVAEGLVTEAFGDMAWRISDMRDKMIHFNKEDLGRIGGIVYIPKSKSTVTINRPSGEPLTFEVQDYEAKRRPLRKIDPSQKLKTVLDGIKTYQALVDTYFANMIHEIKALKILEYET